MKQTSILLLLSLLVQFISAQPTQAEIDKMIKDAKAEIEKLKKDPNNAEMMKNLPNMDSVMKIMKKADNQTGIKNTKPGIAQIKKNDSSQFVLPAKNDKYLNALPVRTFTKAELVSYLHNLNSKLTDVLRSSYGTDIKNIPANALVQTGSSIALWINGEANESVLVALKSAEMNPDNGTLLNNVGGILTAAGLGVNAIPVLQYVSAQQPDNNMILNNLGQAYFAMGDHKKAEEYLLQCIKSSKYFPDANLALAYINNGRGNKAAAIKYAENSLRGAYHPDSHYLLLTLKPDAKLMDYIRHRYKQPEYFNYHKYPLLPQCITVDDAPVLKPQYLAYEKMLSALIEKYSHLEKEEGDIANKTATEKMMKSIKANRNPYRPFGTFAIAVLADLIGNEYTDKFLRFDKYKTNYNEEVEKLKNNYDAEIKKINDGAGSCNDRNAVGNVYLPQFAILRQDFQIKAIDLYNNYLNDMTYWSFIASIDEHGYKTVYYNMVVAMLQTLKEINTTEFIFPCSSEEKPASDATPLKFEVPDCFLNPRIVLPLGAVKLEISCETYKLEAGEGLIGKFEYNRFSGDMTIAFGVGGAVPKVFFKGMGMEVGVEAEAKSQFFITIDKSGHPTDMGVLWEAELKGVLGMGEVKGEIGYGEGLTAGFGSGVQMKEGGPLKYLIDKTYYVQPDAKQINKNVPLYKK